MLSGADQSDSPPQPAPQNRQLAIDLKGSVFTITVMRLYHNDLAHLERELRHYVAKSPRFFNNAPVVIDVSTLQEPATPIDFKAMAELLRGLHLVPVGVRHADAAQQDAAVAAGLAIMNGGTLKDLPGAQAPPAAGLRRTPPAVEHKKTGASQTQATKVIHQPVRSGQQIYARGGDLVVLAAVNAGAEIVADGNIHVYAPLRGRALAGVQGGTGARIFCQHMAAELVAIAGHYRVFEDAVPREFRDKPVQVHLDKEQLVFTLL